MIRRPGYEDDIFFLEVLTIKFYNQFWFALTYTVEFQLNNLASKGTSSALICASYFSKIIDNNISRVQTLKDVIHAASFVQKDASL